MRPSAPQPPRRLYPRPAARQLFVLTLVAAALSGCGSSSNLPEPEPGAYEGPPIVAGTLAGEHILIASLPAPGYEFTLDGTREALRCQDVFVTLRRPNPSVLYPSVPVELRLSTGVPLRTQVRAFARIVDFTNKDNAGHRQAIVIPAVTAGIHPPRQPVSTESISQ